MGQNVESKPTVLVVDNNEVILNLTKRILRFSGSEIITIDSAEQAFSIFHDREQALLPIDQLWTDINMPGGENGIRLLYKVIENYPFSILKMGIVIMSATLDYDLTNVDRYSIASQVRELRTLDKPFSMDTALNYVNELGKRSLNT